MHFRRLGLTTTYRHQTHPNDFLFEDIKVFKDTIIRKHLRHIPEEKNVTLAKTPR